LIDCSIGFGDFVSVFDGHDASDWNKIYLVSLMLFF